MRIFKRLVVFLLIFSLTPSAAHAAAQVPATFTFQGSGYGHGVGMSQIGAKGQALEGKTAQDILRYYYSSVTVEPVVDTQLMRVNIGHLVSSLTIKNAAKAGQIQIFAGDIKDATSAPILSALPAKGTLNMAVLGTAAFPSIVSSDGTVVPLQSGKSWTIRWTGTRYMQGDPAIVSVNIGGVSTNYRYGQIQVKLVKAAVLGYRLEITNTVRLHDEYLWGIGEVPSSWPLAALQAQAIASRTYALNKPATIRTACDCNIYGASQDQAFVGYAKEIEPKYGQLWKSAVNSTATDDSTGLAVLFDGLPISAYFSSSSGGITDSAQNVWGNAVPYAVSVPDPWSLDPALNLKYAKWIRPVTQSVIASAFGLADVATIFVTNKHDTGSVATVVGTSSAGVSVKLAGGTFASRAKLPSSWFDVLPQQVIIPTDGATNTPIPSASSTPIPMPTLRERN